MNSGDQPDSGFNSNKILSKSQFQRISHAFKTKIVISGAKVFREGETLHGMYHIKTGICKVSKLSENGRDQIVNFFSEGDLIGQRSVLISEPSNLTATAISDMELYFIPKQDIINTLKSDREFSMEMLKRMATNLKDIDDTIVSLAQKSVKKRLAETLIFVSEKFGEDANGFLKLTLSREDYANVIGTATESAIRVLSQLKKEGYISTSGKQIKIENMAALSQFV